MAAADGWGTFPGVSSPVHDGSGWKQGCLLRLPPWSKFRISLAPIREDHPGSKKRHPRFRLAKPAKISLDSLYVGWIDRWMHFWVNTRTPPWVGRCQGQKAMNYVGGFLVLARSNWSALWEKSRAFPHPFAVAQSSLAGKEPRARRLVAKKTQDAFLQGKRLDAVAKGSTLRFQLEFPDSQASSPPRKTSVA